MQNGNRSTNYLKHLVILAMIFLFANLLVLSGCQKQIATEQESNKKTNSARKADKSNKGYLLYTFSIEDQEYQFNLPEGWRKYPSQDSTIAFLVANQSLKAFMSAGFEEKTEHQSLADYVKQYQQRINEAGAIEVKVDDHFYLNGLKSSGLTFQLPEKTKTLYYRVYLIETPDYIVHLGGWTSQEKPSQATLDEIKQAMDSFKMLKV